MILQAAVSGNVRLSLFFRYYHHQLACKTGQAFSCWRISDRKNPHLHDSAYQTEQSKWSILARSNCPYYCWRSCVVRPFSTAFVRMWESLCILLIRLGRKRKRSACSCQNTTWNRLLEVEVSFPPARQSNGAKSHYYWFPRSPLCASAVSDSSRHRGTRLSLLSSVRQSFDSSIC